MAIDKNKKNECCGCMACVDICPVNAITVKKDEETFLYPVINKQLCVNCDLCEKVCVYRQKAKD